MVRSYLPTPDEYRKNPVIKSAKPLKMYLKKKVRGIEGSKAFKDRLAEAQKRSKAARKVADGKRKDLLGEVDAIEITVTPLPLIWLRAMPSSRTTVGSHLVSKLLPMTQTKGSWIGLP